MESLKRSICPITNVLDVVGDRWSLLLVRDMMLYGKRRYGDFLASDEGITTNILADRLKRLEEYGIIEKAPYQQNPVRYEYYLTEKGNDLRPIIGAMINWGLKYIPGTERKVVAE